MKDLVAQLIEAAVASLKADGSLPEDVAPKIMVERTRDPSHGDFASNIAMMLAKPAKSNPRALAEKIVAALPQADEVTQVDIAGPGFINFFVSADSQQAIVSRVLKDGDDFGRCDQGANQRIQIEFVSANPTGPLHVGHGRGAAYGASLAELLRHAGYDVYCEYYVNDAGRQMNILATSVWLRYLELAGEELTFPANGYKGDYIWDIAATLHRENNDALRHATDEVFANVPADEPEGGDKELHIDGLIERAQMLLGEADYRKVFDMALDTILDDIRDDLGLFNVNYDNWYSERGLTEGGSVARAIQTLTENGHVYEQDGAQWFKATAFGDEKDRVLVRDNGITTYFASDVAYHMEKLERGFDKIINIWGADHHGYVPRVKAAMQALGADPDCLDVLLVQFAVLYENGEKLAMSTRSGEFVTLRQLRKDVGSDAARFFYVMRRSEQHLDFDLTLAKSQSNDNPVYYIQYAHARVCAVFRQLEEKGYKHDAANGEQHLGRLTESHEEALMKSLARYPELIDRAAKACEPHQVAHFMRELANEFHSYYNAHHIIIDDADLRDARLNLISAVRQVLQNGLRIIGVSAPEKM